MSILDSTIVNVALPQIQHDLHFTQSSLSWVLNGYLITFGSFLLLGGRLGDLIGRRRMFLSGIRFSRSPRSAGLANSQGSGRHAVRPGPGRRRGSLGNSRDHRRRVSRAPGTRAGDVDLHVRHRRRGIARPHPRWGDHRSHQLALDLLHQPAHRPGRCSPRTPVDRRESGARHRTGSRCARLGSGDGVDDLPSPTRSSPPVRTAGDPLTPWASAAWLSGCSWRSSSLSSCCPKPIMPLRVFRVPGLAGSSVVRGLLMAGIFSTFFIGVLFLEQVRGFGALPTGLAFLAQTVVLGALSLGSDEAAGEPGRSASRCCSRASFSPVRAGRLRPRSACTPRTRPRSSSSR